MLMNLKERDRFVVNHGEGLTVVDFGCYVSVAEKRPLYAEATVVRGRSSWPRKRRKAAMDKGGCLFPIGRSVDDGGPAEVEV
ncbi:hypothetical protein B296_00020346 [Ensete ventricosum]|uniref:Uncharacterized protein n=1 Tax=Ensete ventricosum TaxID=4639 RepID=A0A426ZNJ3_ENSVE|nr:hypothetical protein B296_00020346 [Ensete ventricosum]